MSEDSLDVLLTAACAQMTRELHAAGAGRGWRDRSAPSPAMWFGLVRAVTADGVAQSDLPRLTCVSRRAVRQACTSGSRAGWVEVEKVPGQRGARVRLGPEGAAAHSRWAAINEDADGAFRDRLGANLYDRLRNDLERVVAQFDLEYPHYPISYGSADPSITGGRYRPASEGPPHVPAHGQDWVPVVRERGQDSVAPLPMTALVSQALVGFAVDYGEVGGALVIAEALARGFSRGDTTLLPDAPHELGIAGNGRSGLERHGIVSVATNRDGTQVVTLTARGRRMRDAYAPLVTEVERRWASAYGGTTMSRLRASLEKAAAKLGPDLPHSVLVRHVT